MREFYGMVESDECILPNLRMSYTPCIFAPSTYNVQDGEEPNDYEVEVLFPQTDLKTVATIQDMAEKVIKHKWGSEMLKNWKKNPLLNPVRDPAINYGPAGTSVARLEKNEATRALFEGNFYAKATDTRGHLDKKTGTYVEKPAASLFRIEKVVAKVVKPASIEDKDLFYAGAYVHLYVAARAYEVTTKNGQLLKCVKLVLKRVIASAKQGERFSTTSEKSTDDVTAELAALGVLDDEEISEDKQAELDAIENLLDEDDEDSIDL